MAEDMRNAKLRGGKWRMIDRRRSLSISGYNGNNFGSRYNSNSSEGCGLQTCVMLSASRKGIPNQPSNNNEAGNLFGSGGG